MAGQPFGEDSNCKERGKRRKREAKDHKDRQRLAGLHTGCGNDLYNSGKEKDRNSHETGQLHCRRSLQTLSHQRSQSRSCSGDAGEDGEDLKSSGNRRIQKLCFMDGTFCLCTARQEKQHSAVDAKQNADSGKRMVSLLQILPQAVEQQGREHRQAGESNQNSKPFSERHGALFPNWAENPQENQPVA